MFSTLNISLLYVITSICGDQRGGLSCSWGRAHARVKPRSSALLTVLGSGRPRYFPIVIEIKQSSIYNTTSIIIQIQLLIIILLKMIFITDIFFSYSDITWLIWPPMTVVILNTKMHYRTYLWLLFGIDNKYAYIYFCKKQMIYYVIILHINTDIWL